MKSFCKYHPSEKYHPGNTTYRSILLTIEEEILLQTRSLQYSTPHDPSPATSEAPQPPTRQPLMICRPNTEAIACMPHAPLHMNVHNPHAEVAHSYNLIDNLAQSPAAMSVMEVLQTCHSQ
jgi:hypothetical protein